LIGFNSVLKRLKQVLDKSEVHYAVVGAIAGINYGRTRTTIDIDLIIAKGELETVTLDGTVDIKITNFKIKVASLEIYLISKLYFMKDIVNEQKPVILEYKDVQDFMAVYILQKDNLNEKEFMELIDRFGLRKVFEIILDIIKSVRDWK
jgi:hypothetical protein